MTEHPRDEFDRVPETSERQGVHRERLIPAGSSGLALKITVGILALLIGLGAYFILPRLGIVGGDTAAPPAAAGSPSQESGAPSASAAPAGSATPGDGATDGSSPTAAAGASASPTDNDEVDGVDGVDRTQTVNILNGTGSPGLASVAAGRLAEEGWGSVLPGNWAGAPVDTSVVFYNGEEQRVVAEAVAEDLGITDLVDSADVSPDVSVVLGPEFQ